MTSKSEKAEIKAFKALGPYQRESQWRMLKVSYNSGFNIGVVSAALTIPASAIKAYYEKRRHMEKLYELADRSSNHVIIEGGRFEFNSSTGVILSC